MSSTSSQLSLEEVHSVTGKVWDDLTKASGSIQAVTENTNASLLSLAESLKQLRQPGETYHRIVSSLDSLEGDQRCDDVDVYDNFEILREKLMTPVRRLERIGVNLEHKLKTNGRVEEQYLSAQRQEVIRTVKEIMHVLEKSREHSTNEQQEIGQHVKAVMAMDVVLGLSAQDIIILVHEYTSNILPAFLGWIGHLGVTPNEKHQSELRQRVEDEKRIHKFRDSFFTADLVRTKSQSSTGI